MAGIGYKLTLFFYIFRDRNNGSLRKKHHQEQYQNPQRRTQDR